MTSQLRRVAFAAAALAAFAAAPARAQEEEPFEPAGEGGGLDVSVTATFVSDYRFRGISSSGRDPALQGSVDVEYEGFYATLWASSIARTADTNVEADLYVGYAGSAGAIGYEIGAVAYLYPGGDGSGDIYELTGALSHTIGPAELRLEANYAPDQENLDGDNLYLAAEARVGVPATPLTVFGHFGRERGSFYGRKLDWFLGTEFTQDPLTLSIAWHDTNLDSEAAGFGRDAAAGVVVTASVTF